jgi:hypothetical protein
MRTSLITLILTISLAIHAQLLKSQINQDLAEICDSIQTVDDNTDPNYSQLKRSRSYDIRIEHDSLMVFKWEKDCYLKTDGGDECRTDSIWHQVAVSDIGDIHFECKIKGQNIYPYLEGRLEINSLRNYNLIQRTYADGTVRQTWYIPLTVINFQDTVHFQALADLLNTYIKTQNNYIEPNCGVEELDLYSKQRKVKAIENTNLKTPITINGNSDITSELQKVLLPYIKAQNIPKIYGDIIIGDNDSFYHFISEQNNMFNYLQTLDSIPRPYEVMKKTAYFEVTNEQRKYMEDVLAHQDWTSGWCKDKKVISYLTFHITNKDYSKDDR